jgi:hypothetical protein
MIVPLASFMNIAGPDLIVLGIVAIMIAIVARVLVGIVRFCTRSNPRLARPVGGIVTFVGAIPIVYSIILFTSYGNQVGVPFGPLLRSLFWMLLVGLSVALAGIWLALSPPREPK